MVPVEFVNVWTYYIRENIVYIMNKVGNSCIRKTIEMLSYLLKLVQTMRQNVKSNRKKFGAAQTLLLTAVLKRHKTFDIFHLFFASHNLTFLTTIHAVKIIVCIHFQQFGTSAVNCRHTRNSIV